MRVAGEGEARVRGRLPPDVTRLWHHKGAGVMGLTAAERLCCARSAALSPRVRLLVTLGRVAAGFRHELAGRWNGRRAGYWGGLVARRSSIPATALSSVTERSQRRGVR